MAQKPESQFEGSVNHHLPRIVHHEKAGNPYRRGTPDHYYEGPANILWAEYKFYPKLPPLVSLTDLKAKVCLSKHQQNWLTRAHKNNRLVAVICGVKGRGGFILPGLWWQHPWPDDEVEQLLISKQAIAFWITQHTRDIHGSTCTHILPPHPDHRAGHRHCRKTQQAK